MNNRVRIIIEKDGEQIESFFTDCFIVAGSDLIDESCIHAYVGLICVSKIKLAKVVKSIIRGLITSIGVKQFLRLAIHVAFLRTREEERRSLS